MDNLTERIMNREETGMLILNLYEKGYDTDNLAFMFNTTVNDIKNKVEISKNLLFKISVNDNVKLTTSIPGLEKVSYELDAEFFLGKIYEILLFKNHYNIEMLTEYIRKNGAKDLPENIVLGETKSLNTSRRKKVFEYASKREQMRHAYALQVIKLKAIYNNDCKEIAAFDLLTENGLYDAQNYVQKRINTGFASVIDLADSYTIHNMIPQDAFYWQAAAQNLAKNKIEDVRDLATDLSEERINLLNQYIKSPRVQEIDFGKVPGYTFLFSTYLCNIIRHNKVNLFKYEKHLLDGTYTDFQIYEKLKKTSGFGEDSMAQIYWYRHNREYAEKVCEERRKAVLDFVENGAEYIHACIK